jgi:hypothetical protein
MSEWTAERVLALAPDSSSVSAGQGLANARSWKSLGRSERAVWGLCQGSGKAPYQCGVDLSEPAFKCSCPSRKFPCKHGLAVMLLFAKNASAFKSEAEPAWVSDWLASREQREEKKAAKAASAADKPVDVEAQAKRAAQRQRRVQDGVAECRVWLSDVVRRGLIASRGEGSAWERAAARMVDAQATGLAGFVRQIPELMASGAGWEARTLDHLGKLHLLLSGAERMEVAAEAMGAALVGDVRVALGWNQPKEEVLAGTGVSDRWVSLAQVVEDQERVRSRRTWLVGRTSGRCAMVLDYAVGAQAFDASLGAGEEFDGELAFYPGRVALRALVKSRANVTGVRGGDVGAAMSATWEDGLRAYAAALAANPWLHRWLIVLRDARLGREGESWFLMDATGVSLPLTAGFAAGIGVWRLASITGGQPTTVAVEWDGEVALPVAAIGARGCEAVHAGAAWKGVA